MARMLFYFPNADGTRPAAVDVRKLFLEAGLDTLLRDGDALPKPIQLEGPGPSGKCGTIAAWYDEGQGTRDRNPRLGYFPDAQTWWPCKADKARGLAAGRVWFGYETNRKPRPEDFQRNDDVLISGFDMTLSDGRVWHVPNFLNVPHRCGLDDDGEPARIPKAAFQHYCDRAAWALEQCEAHLCGALTIGWRDTFEYVVEFLALNYRVNLELADWLELFDEHSLLNVMSRTTDLDRILTLQAELKKKDAA